MENLSAMLVVISVLTGVVYGAIWVPRANGLHRSILKTLPVCLLSMAAIVSDAPFSLGVALMLCAAGDAFLSRDGEMMFLAGLGSFLLGHLALVILFVKNPLSQNASGLTMATIVVVTMVVATLVLYNLWKHLGTMKIPVVIYTLIIGLMNISAWETGQSNVLLVGVTLFVFSDMVLAHELFFWKNRAIKKLSALTVWFSYFIAQFLITVSFVYLT